MIHIEKIDEGQDADTMLLNSVTTWLTGTPPQRQIIHAIIATQFTAGSRGYIVITEDPPASKETT